MLALMGGGFWFYVYQERDLRQASEANLRVAAQLKVNQIVDWRSEKLRDAAAIMQSSFLGEAVERWFANLEAELAEKIVSRFRAIQELFHYRDVMLVDRDGKVRLSLTKNVGSLHADAARSLTEALRQRMPVLTDLHSGPDDLPPHIDVVAPLMSDTRKLGKPIGAVILQLDARKFLYPLIQFWPTPSRSVETLLVRKDGDAVLFLNDLRHQPDTALKLRIPLTKVDLPASMAVLGKEGVVQGKDYRGVDVLAVLKAVPNSPWFMVAKVDEAEALAGWRFRSILILSLVGGLLAFLCTAVGMAWQKNRKAHYKELFLAEAALRRAEVRHRITLMSVGDAILSTDTEGRVELLNPIAEALTGWTQEEACGKPLAEVFRICNEETRRPVEDPMAKVLREGMVVGLANHTLLMARDGTERPIADSGAPIRDEHGAIIGVVLVFRDQSEERAAQRLLVQEKEKAQKYLDIAGVLLLALDTNGHVMLVNRKGCEILGYEEQDVLGKNWFEHFLPEEVRDDVKGVFSNIIAGHLDMVEYMENVVLAKDGESRLIAWHNSVLRDQDGSIIGTLSSGADITERKQAEDALKASEERYRSVFDNAAIGIDLVDKDGRFLQVNESLAKMLGYSEDELLDRTIFDVSHPEDVEISRIKHEQMVNGEVDSYRFEKRYIRKDGRVIWADVSVSPVRGPNGVYVATVGVISDITLRKRAEESMRESEERFRRLYEQSPAPYQSLDAEGNLIDVNSAWLATLGYDRGEVIGKWFGEFLAGDSASLLSERFEQLKERGENHDVEYELKRKDGTTILVSFEARVARNDKGEFLQTHCVFTNITERRNAEIERERLASAIEQAAEIVVITDAQGTILYVNPAFEKVTGYKHEEAIGKTPRILKSGEHDTEFYKRLWGTIKGGDIWSGRLINRKRDGQLYHEDATISPVKDSSGKIVNFVAVKRDITEHLELSKQLYQAQKMEAVGTLAGGVAHDFNNILQVVLGYSELILGDEKLPGDHRADLEKIRESAGRGADLVQRLLTFGKKAEIKPQPLNLNHRITELRKMLERIIPKMIDIQLLLDEDLATIDADPIQIDQVLMNLAVNARDAMPEGGALFIETQNVIVDADCARSHLEAKPGQYVLLRISDTGHGMDKETLEHIFEPFYTTKRLGQGTGLGLAMLFGIVKQHHGFIKCNSEIGHGTTFSIYLPALASHEDIEQTRVGPMPRRGAETILLVDDEDLIRDLGKRILRKAGYTVLTASNGKEALEIYRKEQRRIALVILDLIMPEMGGEECLEGLLSLDPSVKVLIATGHSANAATKKTLSSGAMGVVSKPYDIPQVLEIVREVLDAQSSF